MGRTRHSQSCATKGYFTYDERHQRTNAYTSLCKSGIVMGADSGTMRVTVGGDSHRNFDSCWLCSQTCDDPVVTTHGMLYCRACIVENMAHQKKESKRKMEVYESHLATKAAKLQVKEAVLDEMKASVSATIADSILPQSGAELQRDLSTRQKAVEDEAENEGVKRAQTSSFWLATNAPAYAKEEAEKPDMTVRDPFNKKPLKLKQLRGVQWTEETSGKKTRYVCPVSRKNFKNGTDITILPDGTAVSAKALKPSLGKDADGTFISPVTSESLLKSELIQLAKAGTGFVASTEGQEVGGAVAEKYRPSLSMAVS
eukprot:TRINITY_DN29149_c0_g1_i1.p1 TRINITY_DN29149_c0_g1~~TRINITY_DN29149_c0_g1_i1.p1  ORF type:complete len:314 (+),score=105.51 TRINITY_DN29149_c0_g1_i1:214-1155(+)